MPNYTFIDKTTNEEVDMTSSWEDFQILLSENPNFEQVFKMNLAYRLEKLKVSDDWRSRLKAMKKANPNSTIEIP